LRTQGECGLVELKGLGEPALILEDGGEIGERGGIVGICLDGLHDQLDGFLEVAALVGNESKIMERLGMPGGGGKNFPVNLRGAFEFASLLKGLGLFQRRGGTIIVHGVEQSTECASVEMGGGFGD